jgi:vacuolar iron transporter family protein
MDKETQQDIRQYRASWQDESDSAFLYRAFAAMEPDKALAAIYQRMAEAEDKHKAVWEAKLRDAKQPIPTYHPGWRARALGWIAQRFGVHLVIPVIAAQERKAYRQYDQDATAIEAGMPEDERSHARLFTAMQTTSGEALTGARIAQIEGRHRTINGGNALRAAVLGASDGLTSNLSLIMGVAGASLNNHAILLAGLAGMLAGGLSMAIGEWLSVQSARDLYEHQIGIEREELAAAPEAEQEELALIYQAKGIDQATAEHMAKQLISQGDAALDTLAREELGLDPAESGSAAFVAAFTSFLLFSLGAIIPVLPYFFGSGSLAMGVSLLLSIGGLFVIGVGISLTTGISVFRAGGRQVLLGLLAALITFSIGKLIGHAIG